MLARTAPSASNYERDTVVFTSYPLTLYEMAQC